MQIDSESSQCIIQQHVLGLGILITGGNRAGRSAEMYIPEFNTTCRLPKLPDQGRSRHTQDGELACGGWYSSTCIKWSSESGNWTQSHTLRQSRREHVSWATEDGVYLIGGGDSSSDRTTELVMEDGSVEDGFSLRYDTQ